MNGQPDFKCLRLRGSMIKTTVLHDLNYVLNDSNYGILCVKLRGKMLRTTVVCGYLGILWITYFVTAVLTTPYPFRPTINVDIHDGVTNPNAARSSTRFIYGTAA
jgi:hypothetical protein